MLVEQRADSAEARGLGPSAGTAATSHDLAEGLAALARLFEREDPLAMPAQIVLAAVQLVPGVEEASFAAVTARGRVRPQVASGELATRVEALQHELGEGPCLDAVRGQCTVRVADLASDQRWPGFAPRGGGAGVLSMMSLPLSVRDERLGALNLVSRVPYGLTRQSERVATLIACHAALAYAAARKRSDLLRAVETRDLIGQAKGILMERAHLTAAQAFAALSRVSQDRNCKLGDVVRELIESTTAGLPLPFPVVVGALPPDDAERRRN